MVDWTSYWGAIGVAELLVIGTLFFLFPEPLTSVFGIALILTAAGVWLAGWYRGDRESESRRDRGTQDRTMTEGRRTEERRARR